MSTSPHQISQKSLSSDLSHSNQTKAISDTHGRFFGPDLIRAIAVLLVLMSHTLPWNYAAKFFGTEFFAVCGYLTGFFGVEIFFVLSGYLIGGILLKDMFSGQSPDHHQLFHFWKRRWFRTLPNYYFFLLVYFLLARYFETPEHKRANHFFWFGQAVLNEHPVFFNPAWSLAVEEWFYFLFPFVTIVLSRLFRSPNCGLLMGFGLFLVFPILLRGTIQSESWDEGTRKTTFFRLDSVMYGFCLAYIKSRRAELWVTLQKIWLLGAVLLVGLLFWWGHNWKSVSVLDASSLSHRTLPFFCVSLGLFLLFPQMIVLKGLGRKAGFSSFWTVQMEIMIQKISLWSYSMYLSHAAFIMLLGSVFLKVSLPYSELRTGLLILSIWISTIGFSAIWYRVFEKPLTDLRDYQPNRKPN